MSISVRMGLLSIFAIVCFVLAKFIVDYIAHPMNLSLGALVAGAVYGGLVMVSTFIGTKILRLDSNNQAYLALTTPPSLRN